MPEKVSRSELQKCNSCASRTSDGPGLGRLSTVSHPQVCCLHMVAKQEHFSERLHFESGSQKGIDPLRDDLYFDLFHGEGSLDWLDGLCDELLISDQLLGKTLEVLKNLELPLEQHVNHPILPELDEGTRKRRHDGLWDVCHDVEFHVDPVHHGQPPTSRDSAPEGSCEAASEVRGSPAKKRKIIEPRIREGFKKLTLEWRPPRFKRKIWFGTYSADEIRRALDAVTYYLQLDDPYFLADSRRIFAERPLTGIQFQDLLPSCDQYVDKALVKGNLMGITSRDFLQPSTGKDVLAACVVYGRQVKKVIHTVLGKHKKSAAKKTGNVQKLVILDSIESALPSFSNEELAALVMSSAQIPQHEWGYAGPPFPLDEMFSLPTFPIPSFWRN